MCWPLKVYGKAAVFGMVFLALLAGACATTAAKKSQQLEEAWQGKSVKELLARKGPPDAKSADGQGGQIFAYSAYERESDSDAGRSRAVSQGQGSDEDSGRNGSGGGRGSGGRGGRSGSGGSSRRGSSPTYLVHERYWINPDGSIYRVTYQQEGR